LGGITLPRTLGFKGFKGWNKDQACKQHMAMCKYKCAITGVPSMAMAFKNPEVSQKGKTVFPDEAVLLAFKKVHNIWLVVWNMFFSPYFGKNNPN